MSSAAKAIVASTASRTLSAFATGALQALAGSAISQGIGIATRLQKKFDFAGLAGAGIGGGLTNAIGLGGTTGLVVNNMAGGIANAGARSVIDGTSFGDNLIAALPDIIGSTVGSLFTQGVRAVSRRDSNSSPKMTNDLQRFSASPRDNLGTIFRALSHVTEMQLAQFHPMEVLSYEGRDSFSQPLDIDVNLPAPSGARRGIVTVYDSEDTGDIPIARGDGSIAPPDQVGLADRYIYESSDRDIQYTNAIVAVINSGGTRDDVIALANAYRFPTSFGPDLDAAISDAAHGKPWSINPPKTKKRERTWGEWISGSPVGAFFVAAANVPTIGLLDELTGVINSIRTGNPIDVEIGKANTGKQLLAREHPGATLVGTAFGAAITLPVLPASATSSGTGLLVTSAIGGGANGYFENNNNRAQGAFYGAVTTPFFGVGAKALTPVVQRAASATSSLLSKAKSYVPGAAAAESGGIRIATEGPAVAGQGESLLLNQIREAGGTLPVSRGQFGVQDIAGASRAGGNEIAFFGDRATGQLHLRELGSQMGRIPENSRLILHTQPGEGWMSVMPSGADRVALTELGQKSSVIVNFDATHAVRFRPTNTGEVIHVIGNPR